MIALLLFAGHAAGVTPVQKVLGMLEDMKAKGAAAMQTEQTVFAEYQSWCKGTDRAKDVAIQAADDLIGKLKAKVQKADAQAAQLGDDVARLDGEIAQLNKEKQDATEVRDGEHADFVAMNTDYEESLDAMENALRTLKRVSGNIGNAFVQTAVRKLEPKLPAKARRVLAAFLQDAMQSSSPAGNAYESSVGSVIEMIEGLQKKLGDENAQLEEEEAGAKHAYQMLMQQLTMSIEAATNERDTKAGRKAQRVEASAQHSAELASTTSTRDEDITYRADLEALCTTKAVDFAARQQLRQEELEALQQAIDIIASSSVQGKADKHLPALVQRRSFALLRAKQPRKVAQFLQEQAHKHHSTVLSQLAQQVADGPFDKVAQMIRDLIAKLTAEANEEAEHKGWCDSELASNKQTREQKTETVDELMALSDQLNAEISRLSEEIAELSAAIAELDAAVEQATAQRQKEKKENTEAIADAKVAQEAVQQAQAVLKAFYAKAATATALVQAKQSPGDDAPASFDEPYRGMGGSSTGVLGMLDTILSDFVRLEQETKSDEASASREYDEFSAESARDRSVKAETLDADEKSKTKKAEELNQADEDLKRTQTELGAAMDYYDELKKSCVDANVSFKERVQRREEEIESLKEALKILSDE